MTRIVIYSAAEREYAESLCWYAERSKQAASDFDQEFDDALATILADPLRFPACDERHRFYLLRRFPFQIVFRLAAGDVHIVAVAHTARNPEYWAGR